MATSSTTTTVILSLILIEFAFAFAPASALDCTPGYGCSYVHHPNPPMSHFHNIYSNRKVLMGVLKAQAMDQVKPNYGVELRDVPSGPDPLHHNNGPQKRPRISP